MIRNRALLKMKRLRSRVTGLLTVAPHKYEALLKSKCHPFDLQYGVDTSGYISGQNLISGHPHDHCNTAYYAMSPSRFAGAVNRWRQGAGAGTIEEYAFIDLGCGKGRALLMASALPFREAIGVELYPELARIARANVDRWAAGDHLACPTTILCQEATEFLFPRGPCLLYLFHPFGAPVLERLLNSIALQFRDRSDMLDIIYFNPEAGDLIERHPGFVRLWTEVLPMSREDAAADWLAGEDDLCSAYRWTGMREDRRPRRSA
jgi:hypothetical protein